MSRPIARRQRSVGQELFRESTTKVAVVTGADTGLGYESTKFLLSKGAKVYALCQDLTAGACAIDSLNSLRYKGTAIFIHCDPANLPSVLAAAEEILSKEKQVR